MEGQDTSKFCMGNKGQIVEQNRGGGEKMIENLRKGDSLYAS